MKEMRIERRRLPQGWCHPVRSSMFDALRRCLPDDLELSLRYVRSPEAPSRNVLWARYLLPNDNVPHCRLAMTAGDLPASQHDEVARQLILRAIPALQSWVKFVHDLPDGSTHWNRVPEFAAFVRDGALHLSATPALPGP